MKKIALLSAALFIMTISVTALSFPDMPDDWSTTALNSAVDNGLLSGSDGYICPEDNLTRAEMATIIVRAFGAKDKADLSKFTDVPQDEWYYNYLATAVEMKIFEGDDGKLNPDAPILREEAFAVIVRALSLDGANPAILENFADGASVSEWARPSVAALINAKYIQGSDGFIEPQNCITRAEFAQLMHNIFKTYIKLPGVYKDNIDGNVIINSDGVILENLTVNGDLIVAEGVITGVTLNNANIKGRMVFRGGNSNNIVGSSNTKIYAPNSGVVVNHDTFGTLLGGGEFNMAAAVLQKYPNGYLSVDSKIKVPENIMKIADHEISFATFRYYYMLYKAQIDGGNNELWEQLMISDPEKYNQSIKVLKDQIVNAIISDTATTIISDKYEQEFTDADKAEVDEYIKSLDAQYSAMGHTLDQLLAQNYLTRELYTTLSYNMARTNKLYERFYSPEGERAISVESLIKLVNDAGYMRAQHILVPTEEEANKILSKIKNGEDFYSLSQEFGTDPGMKTAGIDGYYFKPGEMIPEFENACKELEINKISGIVKSDFGYHIIKRMPLENDYIVKHSIELGAEANNADFAKLLTAIQDELKNDVSYYEDFELINPLTLH